MIRLQREKLENGIRRAKQFRSQVLPVGERSYLVVSGKSGKRYFVEFTKSADGSKWGQCSCPAGAQGLACHHLCAALGAHLGIARMRAAAAA